MTHPYPELARVVLAHPAIDNHAHPLLTAEQRSAFPFESLVSEASGAAAADIPHTLIFPLATARLAELYALPSFAPGDPPAEVVPGTGPESTWEALKTHRDGMDYEDLCALAMGASELETVLLDDGLGGVDELCSPRAWHDQFTRSRCRRIARVEVIAQDLLVDDLGILAGDKLSDEQASSLSMYWLANVAGRLKALAREASVAGFKSVVAYRTGLAVRPLSTVWLAWVRAVVTYGSSSVPALTAPDVEDLATIAALSEWFKKQRTPSLQAPASVRIASKVVNDLIVGITMVVAGMHAKPVQFHTGLGDTDLVLALASPAHLQPLIAAHPTTPIILLHASYPYTRDAALLAALYSHVYLDFGEVFAFISGAGQRAVISQMLEMAPGTKIMWSSDGHWWPESFYLGSVLAREALLDVLTESVRSSRLSIASAVQLAKNALFHNANRVYALGLEPPPGF